MTSLSSFQCPNCSNNLSRGPKIFTMLDDRQVSGTDYFCSGCKYEYIQEEGNTKLTPFKSSDRAQVDSRSSDPSHTTIHTEREEASRAPEEAQEEQEPLETPVSFVADDITKYLTKPWFKDVRLASHAQNEAGRYIDFTYYDGIKYRIHLYKVVQ